MTNSNFYTPPAVPNTRPATIYRDQPLAQECKRVLRASPSMALMRLPQAKRTGDGALLVLGALTLPAVVYSFAQLASLMSGGVLTHAIQSFLP